MLCRGDVDSAAEDPDPGETSYPLCTTDLELDIVACAVAPVPESVATENPESVAFTASRSRVDCGDPEPATGACTHMGHGPATMDMVRDWRLQEASSGKKRRH